MSRSKWREDVDVLETEPLNGEAMTIAGIEEVACQDAPTIRTGIETLDEDLGGGLPLGVLTEVAVTKPSCGGQTLLLYLLNAARRERQLVTLVDGRYSFDPESTPPSLLKHLLWVQCEDTMQAMKAADVLLRDENFGMVLVDLSWNDMRELRRVRSEDWYRLQRLAERSSACVCIFTPKAMIPSAQVRLEMTRQFDFSDMEVSVSELAQMLEVRVLRLRQLEKSGFPKMIRGVAS
ncbi:hypothetical protein MLD52_06050 [Puniceicoccaceae bacterium K14]|nr:hypothetical protein [Puniceicoccaceae bacterium K14]